jgi:predicted neuraminidase
MKRFSQMPKSMMQIEELPASDGSLPPMFHSPTLCALPGDQLLAVWYAGSYEGAADTVLVSARRTLTGGWSQPTLQLALPGLPLGNPVLYAEQQSVSLYFVILYGTWWTDARLARIESTNGGKTWSAPELLRPESGLMLRTPPIRLRTGALLLPVYDERTWAPLVLRQEAGTCDWQLLGDTTARGKAIQPALAELEDGSVLMYSRSNCGRIFASWSFNAGQSWTASQPTTQPNPNSSIALVSTPGDLLVLVYNPDQQGRERLGVSVSTDMGKTWTPPRLLARGRAEYSYPTLLVMRSGTFHTVFTRNRTNITYATFDLTWATGREQSSAI